MTIPKLRRLLLVAVSLTLVSSLRAQEENKAGEKIYQQLCLRCHGSMGEGSKKHKQVLVGTLSLPQLKQAIEKTMPEDNPGSCTGDDAKNVAEYVYHTFYSPLAQARIAPARIEFARLTGHQYQNAVADLVGSFRNAVRWDDQRGLEGEYNSAGKDNKGKKGVNRRDPEIKFNFGADSPIPDKVDAKEFMLRWNGSVLAPESGEYEFIVRSDNAIRLWVNDPKKALIDAWVKSGSETEFRGTIHLLAGRAYPIRLEMRKGVKEKTASIELAWRVPNQSVATIPQRCLLPQRQSESFVLTTRFPPDDRSVGYERGNAVSKAWTRATRDASLEVALYLSDHLAELAGIPDNAKDRDQKIRQFCERFADRALHRPLNPEQKKFFIDSAFEGKDAEVALQRSVLLILNSPRFLFPETNRDLDAFDIANRLALSLWDSLPDRELMESASSGKLKDRAEVTRQAERMLRDPRARAKLREFFLQWLKVDPAPDVSKNRKAFPDFDQATANDLRGSLELFLEKAGWSESGNYRDLLLTEDLYLTGRLAKTLGIKLDENAPFQQTEAEKGVRAGILTHPYLLATFAYTDTTSPIHRGVFLARNVLGVGLRNPPIAVAPVAEDLHPSLTTRERVLLQTKPQACQSCHGVINPLGFTLENFDAIGRVRDQEKGKPIDTSGTYQTRTGEVIHFKGARDLAQYVVKSEESQEAFIRQLFHHLLQQPIRAYGPDQLSKLRSSFEKHDFRIRPLTIEMVTTAVLTPRNLASKKGEVP